MSPKKNFDESRDPRTRDGGHSDSVSETDSESQLPPYQIYTPTSSSSDKSAAGKASPADEEDDDPLAAETERAPLLSDPPPQYEDALKHDAGGGSTKAGDVAPMELADPGAPGNCKKGKCCRRGRKRFRKICLLVLLKIVLLVGAALCLSAAIRGWRAKHYTCTTEYVYEYEYEYDPSSPPPKRDIVLDRGPDSIWGRWPLYDTLSLTTTSGSIAVTIDPQPADPDDPDRPARLVLKTTSGSIAVSFSSPYAASIPEDEMKMDLAELAAAVSGGDQDQEDVNKSKEKKKRKHKNKKHICKTKNKRTYASGHGIGGASSSSSSSSSSSPFPPPRPYEIEIHTESGSISGRFLFSMYASLESGTGSISALLIPVFYPDLPSSSSSSSLSSSNVTLTTRTSTGSQYVRLTEPFEVPASPPSGGQKKDKKKGHSPEYTARSSHVSSGSGSMQIAYPRVWAGEVHAAAHGGQVRLGGKGLQVRQEENGGPVVGFKEPGYDHHEGDDGTSPAAVWWGSRGDMNVSLVAEGSGSIDFFV